MKYNLYREESEGFAKLVTELRNFWEMMNILRSGHSASSSSSPSSSSSSSILSPVPLPSSSPSPSPLSSYSSSSPSAVDLYITTLYERIQSLIGTFDLDPNRVLGAYFSLNDGDGRGGAE
jgi:hypothetical protein